MKSPPLQQNDTCTLCQKPATKVLMTTGSYQGMTLPVAAALCPGCFGRKDRDELLQAYVERIMKPGGLQ